MAEMAAPGDWQSYYDAVFPFAPLVVGGIVYGLLHPVESILSRVMQLAPLRSTQSESVLQAVSADSRTSSSEHWPETQTGLKYLPVALHSSATMHGAQTPSDAHI